MRQTTFDNAERDKIRAVIRAYARENRIGVPNLQRHIAEATKRSLDQIPLKTLQRFLEDKGRTNDGFLIPLAEFVAAAGAKTPHDGLAYELGAFFAREEPAQDVPSHFSGSYEVVSGNTTFSKFKVIKIQGETVNPDKPYGRCEISGAGRSLKVREWEAGPGSAGTEGAFRPPANQGVMLFFDPLIFMLLRNDLTRLPRVYWLQEGAEGKLLGHAMHAMPFDQSAKFPYSELRNFELHPVAEKTA